MYLETRHGPQKGNVFASSMLLDGTGLVVGKGRGEVFPTRCFFFLGQIAVLNCDTSGAQFGM